MNSAKAKDRILAEVKTYKPHRDIEGLDRFMTELEADGYVKVWRDMQGKLINVRITSNGERFVEGGGYRKRRRSKITADLRKAVKWILVTLAGAGLIELATQIARQLLSK